MRDSTIASDSTRGPVRAITRLMADSTFPVMCRFPPELVERIDAVRGARSRNAWMRAAAEAALSDDTQAGGLRADDGHDTRSNASATGAVTVRGASRPAASPQPSSSVVLATKSCGSGCSVLATSKAKRCVRHGLVLR